MKKGPWGTIHTNDRNPWSRRPNSDPNQDDFDAALDELKSKFRKSFNGGGPGEFNPWSHSFLALILGGLFALWLVAGFYIVREGEQAIVLRFGEYSRQTGPGLRYHLPYPFEAVTIRNVSAVNQIDGTGRADGGKESPDQGLILTGDEMLVHATYTVWWRIKNLKDFLFTARDPEQTMKIAAESCVREVIGQSTARRALTEGRNDIGVESQKLLQGLVDEYNMGIEIVSVQLQSMQPPGEVVDAFNDLQTSRNDADRTRNQAESYRNDILPRARGEAEQIVQEARGFSERAVAEASGKARQFEQVLVEFKKHPEVAMTNKYIDTMAKIMGSTPKVVVDGSAAKGVLPYFPLPSGMGVGAASSKDETSVQPAANGGKK